MVSLTIAAIAFVGTHFLLSHPLRRPLVAVLGSVGFLGLYSLVSLAIFGWMAFAYRAAPVTAQWWSVGDGLWAVATIIMLVASILFVGSLFGNPALPDPRGAPGEVPTPRGVFAITRHPMMWSFALWGISHILIFPILANAILAGAIIVLALVGAAFQDAKKARLQPDFWPQWAARTAYWPFAKPGSGGIAAMWPGAIVTVGGILLWFGATWAHMPLVGWDAGIWRWIV